MKNILLLSQKGGTGKTTLADNIAFGLESNGVSVAFYDIDAQGGALHETTEPEDATVAVIDTPGFLTDDTQDMIADADVVVIPTRASALDMPPLERTRDLIAAIAPTVPVLIVLNGFNRWSNAKGFKEWIEENLKPTESVFVLSQSEVVPQAAANGEGIGTFAPKSRPATELAALIESVQKTLDVEASK